MGLGFQEPLRFGQRQARLAEMHTAGVLGKRHVQAIVHQHACGTTVACRRSGGQLQSFAREQPAGPGRKILLPNLQPIDTGSRRGRDFLPQSFLGLRGIESRQAAAVRHVAEE